MTLNAIRHRLHRIFAVLLVLALPMQGQAVASMACHTANGFIASAESVAPIGHPHAAHTLPVSHQHADGQTHLHTAPVPVVASVADQTDLGLLSLTDAVSGNVSDPVTTSNGCALCAACCFVSAGVPAASSLPHLSVANSAQPLGLIASAYAGVVLDGLLRPPR